MSWILEIQRKPGAAFGAAIGTFYKDGEAQDHGPMITGKRDVLDPKEYGGVTPPGEWCPVETLEKRPHLRGDEFTYSRLLPIGEQRTTHSRRTYGIHIKDPFMSHYAGSSSGCPSCLPVWWDKYKKLFNQAFKEGLLISVEESDDVNLDEFKEAFEKYDQSMREQGR